MSYLRVTIKLEFPDDDWVPKDENEEIMFFYEAYNIFLDVCSKYQKNDYKAEMDLRIIGDDSRTIAVDNRHNGPID